MEIAVSLAERRGAEALVIPVKLEECRLPDVLIPYHSVSLFEPGGRDALRAALGLPVLADPLAGRTCDSGLAVATPPAHGPVRDRSAERIKSVGA